MNRVKRTGTGRPAQPPPYFGTRQQDKAECAASDLRVTASGVARGCARGTPPRNFRSSVFPQNADKYRPSYPRIKNLKSMWQIVVWYAAPNRRKDYSGCQTTVKSVSVLTVSSHANKLHIPASLPSRCASRRRWTRGSRRTPLPKLARFARWLPVCPSATSLGVDMYAI